MENDSFINPKEERIVISCLLNNGKEAFYEINNLINEDCFGKIIHKIIYRCIKKIYERDVGGVDLLTIESAADDVGLKNYFENDINFEYLKSLDGEKVQIDNAILSAKRLRKINIAKRRWEKLEEAQKKYASVSGEESIEEILSYGEDAVFDLSFILNDNEPRKIGEGLSDRIIQLRDNKEKSIGISTGFKRYDYAIGMGYRPGTVNLVGARTNIGKSMMLINIGMHCSLNNIPTLFLDTEMTMHDHQDRMICNLARVPLNEYETGKFAHNEEKLNRIRNAYSKVKDLPFYYKPIHGYSWDEQLSTIRSWLIKSVGLNTIGYANRCLILLDYFKLMDGNDLNKSILEFQLMGFRITSLVNLSIKYMVPILIAVQLNRVQDISASDRIEWLVSSSALLKEKSPEEISKDGPHAGNRKLEIRKKRFGPGLKTGEYINILMEGQYASVREGKTNYEIENENKSIDIQEELQSENEIIEF